MIVRSSGSILISATAFDFAYFQTLFVIVCSSDANKATPDGRDASQSGRRCWNDLLFVEGTESGNSRKVGGIADLDFQIAESSH